MAKQTKKVVLDAMDSELRLRTVGVIIRISHPKDPLHTGRFRIREATLQWFPKFTKNPKGEKSWEELIDFMMK